MTTEEEIVRRYLNPDGSLRQMPAKRAARIMVLAHVLQRIPVGEDLAESAINDLLRPVSQDVAMLRRALVDEGLLDRWPPGIYRRPAEHVSDESSTSS